MRTRILVCGVMAAAWACTSCSTGPTPPAPGTPAFFWGAARQTYHSGDFRKTNDNLMQLVRAESEFTARSRPWAAVVSAGLAHGYYDLAEAYETGAKANRQNPTPFRKQVTAYRSFSSAAALEFAETVHVFLDKDKDADVLLACEFPNGSAVEPPNLAKVEKGMLMQESEREQLEAAMLQRGVVRSMSLVVGTPDDSAKALELFKAGEPKVPRATFVYGLAKSLFDLSSLYGSNRLDQPQRLKLLCDEALAALAGTPETKDTKALTAKIQAAVKKPKT